MKKELNDRLFYISYILLLIYMLCTKVLFMQGLINVIYYIIPVLLSVQLLAKLKSMNKKSVLICVLVILLSVIIMIITGEETILLTSLFVICFIGMDFDKFLKRDIIYKLVLVVFIYTCYKLNLTSNTIFYRSNGAIRYSLGFSHPNQLGLILFSISCSMAYLYYHNYKLHHYIIWLAFIMICNYVCDSRAAFVCLWVLVGLTIISRFKFSEIVLRKLGQYLPIIFIIISFSLAYLYNYDIPEINSINKALSGRLMYANNFLNYYNITLFGNRFESYGMARNDLRVLDISYIHILLHFGIVFFILFFSSITKLLKISAKRKDMRVILYLTCFLIYAFSERHLYEVQFNCILLLLPQIFSTKKKELK